MSAQRAGAGTASASSIGSRAAKDALFDAFATVSKALASGRRVEIVELLAQGERSVEEVAEAIEQSVANTSHHLKTLSLGGLVTRRREGTRIVYALAGEQVAQLAADLRDVAVERIAEIERLARAYLGDRQGLEPLSAEELKSRLAQGDITVLDVRPDHEFRAGHIPGARSVPLSRLNELLDTIPDSSEIVAYCRGPYCIYADEAVRQLSAHGYRARRLQQGLPEWRRAGLPVTRSS